MERDLGELGEQLGWVFRQPELLAVALTHRSGAHEAGHEADYERFEFLGDAVLGLVAAAWLFETFDELDEGRLSALRSHLVSASSLADYARSLGLGAWLVLGQGEERSGGRGKTSLLADAMEAVIGAAFLDGGLAAARAVVQPLLDRARGALEEVGVPAKSRLQEEAQRRGLELPVYQVVEESGPDHDKRFTVEVRVAGEVAGRGSGTSKRRAERAAAAAALSERPWLHRPREG